MKVTPTKAGALRFLPEATRYQVLRKSLRLVYDWPEQLEICLATTLEEHEQALKLLHDCYVEFGYTDPVPARIRALKQHLVPQTALLIAKWEGRIVGTVSLFGDSAYGLPLEQLIPLRSLRAKSPRIAEVSSLAIASEFREDHGRILFPILKYTHHYARSWMGISHLVMAVHPGTRDFYRAIFGCEEFEGAAQPYPLVRGNLAIGLSLDLERLERNLFGLYMDQPATRNLLTYCQAHPESQCFQFPERQYQYVAPMTLTPAMMRDLYFAKAELHRSLSRSELEVLASAYRHPNYWNVILEATGFEARQTMPERRFQTHLNADLGSAYQTAEVWNASRHGLFLTTQSRLEKDQRITLRVQLTPDVQTELNARIRWINRMHEYGLEILEATPDWDGMIDWLNQRFETVAGNPATTDRSRSTQEAA